MNKFIYALIILMGLFFRLYLLDERPFHHDEALHAIYASYFFKNPISGFYRYNPLLHGPFLYNFYYPFLWLFGSSHFAIRLFSVFFGMSYLFFPLLFLKQLGRKSVLLLTFFLASSPTLVFWSRFPRHDGPMLFFLFFFFYFLLSKTKKIFSFLAPLSFFLLFSIKENSFVYVAFLSGYLLYEFLFDKKSYLWSKFSSLLKNKTLFLMGSLAGITLTLALYSSFFRHNEIIIENLFGQSFSYWLNQHSIERLKGPFSYHFFSLSWYETFFTLVFIFQIVHLAFRKKIYFLLTFFLFALSLLTYFFIPLQWLDFVRPKISLDLFFIVFLFFYSIISTTIFKKEKRELLAFSSYLFYASFFTYSYLGEKVPWLSLYVFAPGIFFLTLYFREYKYHFNKKIIALFCCFHLYQNILTNIVFLGNKREFISQVQTDEEIHLIARRIAKERKKHILVQGSALWPLSWYFYRHPHYSFNKKTLYPLYDYIFTDTFLPNIDRIHFVRSEIILRHWFTPNYTTMTFTDYLMYTLIHCPWNKPGTKRVLFYQKP
mgnify:CR=1 FL=1